MKKHKTNILLELIDDVIVEYQNTKGYIQQELLAKYKREGILIDTIIFIFIASFRNKNIFTNQTYHNVFRVICKNTA